MRQAGKTKDIRQAIYLCRSRLCASVSVSANAENDRTYVLFYSSSINKNPKRQ